MATRIKWSDLHEELINKIAKHTFSNIELLRLRSICKSWRSSIPTITANTLFPSQMLDIFPESMWKIHMQDKPSFLSAATFFKVTETDLSSSLSSLSSSWCDHKGWLIKVEQNYESGKMKLLCPFSRLHVRVKDQSLDLLRFIVSKICKAYEVQTKLVSKIFKRVVVLDDVKGERQVFVINGYRKIWTWNVKSGWSEMKDQDCDEFCDLIVHKGLIFALDLKSATWWISLSDSRIYRYQPPIPMDDYYDELIMNCDDRYVRTIKKCYFMEFNGELSIVSHLFRENYMRKSEIKTLEFRVYKMDEELVKWVKVESLGDKALVMANGNRFCVKACDYYGCLKNAIYFYDGKDLKVFKLDDGSIITMLDSSSSQDCFRMFFPTFLEKLS